LAQRGPSYQANTVKTRARRGLTSNFIFNTSVKKTSKESGRGGFEIGVGGKERKALHDVVRLAKQLEGIRESRCKAEGENYCTGKTEKIESIDTELSRAKDWL